MTSQQGDNNIDYKLSTNLVTQLQLKEQQTNEIQSSLERDIENNHLDEYQLTKKMILNEKDKQTPIFASSKRLKINRQGTKKDLKLKPTKGGLFHQTIAIKTNQIIQNQKKESKQLISEYTTPKASHLDQRLSSLTQRTQGSLSSHRKANTQRPSYQSNISNKENESVNKLTNLITENNMKRLEKFKSIFYKDDKSTERKPPSSIKKEFTQTQTLNEKKESTLTDKHRRVFQDKKLPTHKKSNSIKCDRDLQTIDTLFIEDKSKQKFEVTINVPQNSLLTQRIRKNSLCSQNEQQSAKVCAKPPKPTPGNLTHRREYTLSQTCDVQALINNFQNKPVSNKQSMVNTSDMSGTHTNRSSQNPQITKPQPFKLSRSNSRRSKDVLIKEKQDLQVRQIQEEQSKQEFRAKDIPKHHYAPNFTVYKSTKNLTTFKEFNFYSNRVKSRRESSQRNQEEQINYNTNVINNKSDYDDLDNSQYIRQMLLDIQKQCNFDKNYDSQDDQQQTEL